jgi:NAD(P)-dependent dehydrogenase (short-subunit alcohol dehydrogenase family)
MNLNGKVALVTGGAARIGAAICRALAAEGACVVIQYRRSKKKALALAKELGGRAVQSNLDSESACERLIARAGKLDILVNNAAVFHKDSLKTITAWKLTDEFWLNLFAPILLTRAFAARVKKGAVVNLLDRRIASLDTSCVPYVLSKKSLAEFTKIAALELAPGIRVNAVAPGAVLPPPGKGKAYLKDHAGPIPMGRLVKAEEVADAVVFLLKSDSVTGQIVFVDGGQNLLGNLNPET